MSSEMAPGVYVDEKGDGARPISAVGTSTACFFGHAPKPDAVAGLSDMMSSYRAFREAYVGDATEATPLVLAAAGFFQNQGGRLYIVNLAPEEDTLREAHFEAIRAMDGLSLLAAPGFTDDQSQKALVTYCENRSDCFAILDGPAKIDTLAEVTKPRGDGGLRPDDAKRGVAAMYMPWLEMAHPITGKKVEAPPSGHMAGLYAYTDARRGVHKAPANLSIGGVTGLTEKIDAAQQGTLNDAGINCIRVFSEGIKVWGARTLLKHASPYQYVPVRRLTTMISQSLERGLRWAVFEPNDLTLWKSIRRDTSAFLHGLWRDGALQGATPEQAFFVKCDAETTTQADIDLGRVNVLIGFAPVKPAEFVMVSIGHSVSGSQTEES